MTVGYCIGGPGHGKRYKVNGTTLFLAGYLRVAVYHHDPNEPIVPNEPMISYRYTFRDGFWRLN